MTGIAKFTERQRALLDDWLPGFEVVTDHKRWGLVDTTVLQVVHDGGSYIVKAAGKANHHIECLLRAHYIWVEPWTSRGRAPEPVHADGAANILVTRFQVWSADVRSSTRCSSSDAFRQAS